MSIFKKWAGRILFNNGISLLSKELGSIEGFFVKYEDTDSIKITAGIVEANGKYYKLSSDIVHDMTSLVGAFDFHYIYIDDSASSGSTPTIIDNTTEPVYSDVKKGWYNGNDRCIGVVVSKNGTAEIAIFSTVVLSEKSIAYHVDRGEIPEMAVDMNPDGSWQTPDDNDGSVVTPVNATAIYIIIRGTDELANCSTRAASAELAAVVLITDGDVDFSGYNYVLNSSMVFLGASRNIKIAGTNDDDNGLSCWCNGYIILR